MSDRLASRLRTYWPWFIGWLAGWVVAAVLRWIGVEVPKGIAVEIVGAFAFAIVYEAGRWLERRTGDSWLAVIARAAGKWVLSIGLDTGEPTYLGATRRR